MKAKLHHIQINVSDKEKSYSFYKDMLLCLGYEVFMEETWGIGMTDGSVVIWICEVENKYKESRYHRKAPGLNHLAFSVASKDEVDKFYMEFIKDKNIGTLYETPKAFPEYTPDYYAVFFEDPDRVKLEVVFTS